MVDYGVTTVGFERKREPDVIDELSDDYQTSFGNTQVDAQSVNGQKIAIHGSQIGQIWEVAEAVYDDAYIDSATDAGLDRIGALVLRPRLPATFSVVELRIEAAGGTAITAGSKVSDGVLEWIISDTNTVDASGVLLTNASPATEGPFVALAGTLTTIVTPIAGWTAVSNPLDAVRGSDAEAADSYRNRIKSSFRTANSSAAGSIASQLLSLPGVTEALVVENRSDFPDGELRPPHSFEPVVRGGSDADIIDQLYRQAAGGAVMVGDSSFVVLDSLGHEQIISFSRPEEKLIYVQVTYSIRRGFPINGEDQILEAILTYGAGFTLGQAVVPVQILQQIEVPGLASMSIKAGLTPFGVTDVATPILKTEVAVFDSTRVQFVLV